MFVVQCKAASMSVVIETLVFCDGCSENHSGDDRSSSAKQIRASRKREGWIQRGSKDYCESCAKKLLDEMKD